MCGNGRMNVNSMQPPELDDTKLAGLAQKEHRDFVGSRLLTAHQR